MSTGQHAPFVFGEDVLSIDSLNAIARGAPVRLSQSPAFLKRIERSAAHVASLLKNNGRIYGVTTGYGDSVVTDIPPALVAELPLHLTRFHGCGLGRFLTPEETRAVLAVRLATLTYGWSGVSLALIQLLTDMLRNDVLPLIPSEGSVGASGDLTPLSYIAGALAGERDVLFRERVAPAHIAFAELKLSPLTLLPKEALAVMNGTSVMAALTSIALAQSESLSELATRLTAMTSVAILGNPLHFDPRLSLAKPHPGQTLVARRVWDDLAAVRKSHTPTRMQDRYSTRCAPHVIGVLEDLFPHLRKILETEINSANDNPLFDPETGDVLHGGHFYGGHVCHAADSLKTQTANLADLMDRQVATLVDVKYNNGLPANLTGAEGARAAINHGFKAVQIAVSAWTAEAAKLSMPASVFSRPTECNNQDKVSMGSIAARDALRINELTAQIGAAHFLCCAQAIEIRMKRGDLSEAQVGEPLLNQIAAVRVYAPFLEEDTPLDKILAAVTTAILAGKFSDPGYTD